MHKLGIIVPYRNRPDQLKLFQDTITSFIKGIDYELIIVDQQDDKDFNRGKLLNIGFLKSLDLGCDYVVFHDIDLLPIDVDYSYSDKVTHLISELDTPEGFDRSLFDEYFGGVTLFPSSIFETVNGYINNYWGWGFEDDNLLLRCIKNRVSLDSKKVIQKSRDGVGLKFNGNSSFVACPNIFNIQRDFSIVVNFKVDKIESVDSDITDNNSIFSIPGFDTALSYNSFRNFIFQFWKSDLSSMSINSKHFKEGSYTAVITIENKSKPKKINLYINGERIGESTYDKLYNIGKPNFIYLGVGDPDRDKDQNWFNGIINYFAIYNHSLSKVDIKRLNKNISKSLFDLGIDGMSVYYEGKILNGNQLVDLSGNSNHGTAFNCSTEITKFTPELTLPVPHRRKGKFKCLPHNENGYKDGYWISWKSRENQLDYLKKYYDNELIEFNNGLSSLTYNLVEYKQSENLHYLKVNLA